MQWLGRFLFSRIEVYLREYSQIYYFANFLLDTRQIFFSFEKYFLILLH